MAKRSLRAPISWVVYDLANTLYSAIVVTFLIGRYTKSILDAALAAAVANFCSMILAGLVAPTLGEVTDRAGSSKRWLVVSTLAACVACAVMGSANLVAAPRVAVWVVLGAFAVANFCYQLSLVFYNSLLPGIVPPNRIGFWSGVGVGVGYFGMTLGMVAMLVVKKTVDPGLVYGLGFIATGVLFFGLSLPLFLWVAERPPAGGTVPRVHEAMRDSFGIWRRTLREAVPRRFLIGNFCLTDALNTTIFFFPMYCENVFDGFEEHDAKLNVALIVLSVSAFALGIVAGKLTDRVGAKRTLLFSAGSLALAIVAGILMPAGRFWVFLGFIASFGAFGLAGIWTAGRALLVQIAPPERLGEYFGMYGLSLKVSVVGSLGFALLRDYLPFSVTANFRWAMASGLVPLLVGMWLIRGLSGRLHE